MAGASVNAPALTAVHSSDLISRSKTSLPDSPTCLLQILPSREISDRHRQRRTSARTHRRTSSRSLPCRIGVVHLPLRGERLQLVERVLGDDADHFAGPARRSLFWNSMNQGFRFCRARTRSPRNRAGSTLPLNAESFTSLLFEILEREVQVRRLGVGRTRAAGARTRRATTTDRPAASTPQAPARRLSQWPIDVLIIYSYLRSGGPTCPPGSTATRPERTTPICSISRFDSTREQHERAVADAPDRRLVPEHLDEFLRARRVGQHEQRHRAARGGDT